jgi:GH3 auxin-responsive promoter
MELFMKYPMDVQEELFENLINSAKNTEWGKKYDYKSIKNYEEYINRVPLQSYESLQDQILRIKHGEQNILWPTDIKWFAKSSGTASGKSKFIPVSKESLLDCHYKGGKDLLAIYHNNHPQTKLIKGKVLVVGGSSEINEFSNNSYYGDLSSIIMKNFPMWVEQRRVPKLSIAIMNNWEEKIEKMAHATVNEDVSNISGVPSWTLFFLNRMLEIYGKNDVLEIWPNLELYMHGGVNFSPYKEQFKKLMPGNQLNYYENYNASEGFFGLQDQSKIEEMLLMLDYGIFYEFIEKSELDKPSPKTITLADVQLKKNYAMIISTNAGLWRYVIGDTVEFTSLSPFRIKVTGRINHFINAFGEELIIENAEKAISKACYETDSIIKEFTVAPVFFTNKSTGKHQWLIEFEKSPINMEHFSDVLDKELKQLNSDYEAKRFNNMILEKPEITELEPGTFYKWMKTNKKLGGQHKIPRLSNDRIYVDDLMKMV